MLYCKSIFLLARSSRLVNARIIQSDFDERRENDSFVDLAPDSCLAETGDFKYRSWAASSDRRVSLTLTRPSRSSRNSLMISCSSLTLLTFSSPLDLGSSNVHSFEEPVNTE